MYLVISSKVNNLVSVVTQTTTTHLSLSSLLTNESRLSESLSLSCELTEALLSDSPGFSQGGGVGKEGGVRCRRFHGSWWLLLLLLLKCCCGLGPSLWPNMELAAVRDSIRGKAQQDTS